MCESLPAKFERQEVGKNLKPSLQILVSLCLNTLLTLMHSQAEHSMPEKQQGSVVSNVTCKQILMI